MTNNFNALISEQGFELLVDETDKENLEFSLSIDGSSDDILESLSRAKEMIEDYRDLNEFNINTIVFNIFVSGSELITRITENKILNRFNNGNDTKEKVYAGNTIDDLADVISEDLKGLDIDDKNKKVNELEFFECLQTSKYYAIDYKK